MQNKKNAPPPTGIIICVLVFLAALILLSIRIVQPGYVGVIVRLGKAIPKTLDEGLHFVVPFFSSVKPLDARIQKSEHKINGISKDLQTVGAEITLNYHINRELAAELYRNIGNDYDSIVIQPKLQESFKSNVAQFTAETLIGEQSLLSSEIKGMLAKQLQEHGIDIDSVSITNITLPPDVNRMIEDKLVAEQRALQARQAVDAARAAAETLVEKARAEAEAMKLKKEVATPNLILLTAVEKWDGKLPTHVLGPASLFENLPSDGPDCVIITEGLRAKTLGEANNSFERGVPAK